MTQQISRSSAQHGSPRASAAPLRPSWLRAGLLATSALASLALVTAARADDATWLADQSSSPASGDFNTGANWQGGAQPDATAIFGDSNQKNVSFSQDTVIGGIRVLPDAGLYQFTNSNGKTLTFTGQGIEFSERASTLFNHGEVDFTGTSSAGNLQIQSDGSIFFKDQAKGGFASIELQNGTGILDMSGAGDVTIGALAGNGNVFLGGHFVTVGVNNGSTVFSGVIQDGGASGGTGGQLSKRGDGTLTLTGQNTYTGPTTVSAGMLVVDGSIASSVTVFGGALAGTGTVSDTLISDGATLVAGHIVADPIDGTFGTLKVHGSLVFKSAAFYLVQLSPTTSGSTDVTGTAILNGATVQASFAPGSYVVKQYTILHASDGFNGTTFSQKVVSTNLSPMFQASLSYDASNVFLNLSAAAPALRGDNVNQRNVANAILNSFFNTAGGVPAAFTTLSHAGQTQISGETAVGSQQATVDAMNQFMDVLLDPTVGGRGAAVAPAGGVDASMPRKAPLAADGFGARWRSWVAGYGGSQTINGDTALGSNKTTSNVFGAAVGADFRLSPNTVAGFALAGGGTHFSVANGGRGDSDLFQAGTYIRHTQGAAFLAAALAYGWQDVTTNRTVTVAGADGLRGRFQTNAVSGRLEGGYRFATQAMDLTPYAAAQITTYHLPSYAEQVTSGAGLFALAYDGKTATATHSELGVKTEKAVALADATLVLRSRLAWAHDFDTNRNVSASFQSLPASAFVVNGAQPAADTALASFSTEVAWRGGWSASATVDSRWSDTTRSYAGKATIRYGW